MRWLKQIMFVVITASVLALQGCSPMSVPNFQDLTLPTTPNYYLVCPQNYCNVTPNAYAPVYPVSAEDLFNAFNQLVAQKQNVHFSYSMPEQGQYQLIARPVPFISPDDISVQFIALSDNTSTLAIISKSRYFYYDFGMNKRRIDEWLQELQAKMQR